MTFSANFACFTPDGGRTMLVYICCRSAAGGVWPSAGYPYSALPHHEALPYLKAPSRERAILEEECEYMCCAEQMPRICARAQAAARPSETDPQPA